MLWQIPNTRIAYKSMIKTKGLQIKSPASIIQIMKINNQQQLQKRSRILYPQKASYIKISPKNDIASKTPPSRKIQPNPQLFDNLNSKNRKSKQTQDQQFTNLFADDSESAILQSRRDNPSDSNLRASFKGLKSQIKNVKQSEKNPTNDHTPPNSLCEKKLSATKSAEHLINPNQGFLIIKSNVGKKENGDQEDTEEVRQLMSKIKEVESENERIKQQNLNLRYIRLSTNQEPTILLKIQLQIEETKRKIEKLKNQLGVTDLKELYTSKKSFQPKPKTSQVLSKNPSAQQFENPYQINSAGNIPILNKSRIEEREAEKRGNQQKSQKSFGNSKNSVANKMQKNFPASSQYIKK